MKNIFKPILFSTPMVQAILEDRKKQTRHTKGLEHINKNPDNWSLVSDSSASDGICISEKNTEQIFYPKQPYSVGDILWVRESFYAYGMKIKRGKTTTGRQKTQFVDHGLVFPSYYRYMDDPPMQNKFANIGLGYYKRNSLFMPKAACRIFLKVKSVKVERLCDLFHSDARAEGIDFTEGINSNLYYNYLTIEYGCNELYSFMTLWQSIYGEDSWIHNKWVWVIEFERIEKPLEF